MGLFERLSRGRPAKNRREFLALAVDVARSHPTLASAVAHPDIDFALSIDDGPLGGESLMLDRPWAFARGESRVEQKAILLEFYTSLAEQSDVPEQWDDARTAIVALLREATHAAHAHDGPTLVTRPAFDGLAKVLYIDLGTVVAVVTPAQLESWGVSTDDAWEAALQNTARHAPDTEFGGERALFRVGATEIDAPSFLLAPGWAMARLSDEDTVFHVADREWLVVCSGCRGELLAKLALRARESWEAADRRVSPRLYRVEGGEVVPVEAAPDHPAFEELELGRHLLAASMYSDQKEALDARYAAQGKDIFVASYLLEEVDGVVRSRVVWSDDCVSVLPEAEVVTLVRNVEGADDLIFDLPMDRVVEAAGLEPVEGLRPVRYFVETWPDERVLDSIRRSSRD